MKQVFNKEVALKTVDYDTELLSEILQLFLNEKDKLLGNIKSAVAEQDRSRLRIAAHSLKGTLLNIGAKQAAEHTAELEHFDSISPLHETDTLIANIEKDIEIYITKTSELTA